MAWFKSNINSFLCLLINYLYFVPVKWYYYLPTFVQISQAPMLAFLLLFVILLYPSFYSKPYLSLSLLPSCILLIHSIHVQICCLFIFLHYSIRLINLFLFHILDFISSLYPIIFLFCLYVISSIHLILLFVSIIIQLAL